MNNQESGKEPSGIPTQPFASSSPQPAPPQKVSSEAVKTYYESISEAFRETIEGREKDASSGWLKGLVIICFTLSVVPVLPYVFSRVMPRLFSAKAFAVLRFHFSLASFWFWWPVCFVGFLLILIVIMRALGPSEAEQEKWLSQPQMRFGYAYGGIVEIRHYKTNRLPRHIQTATEYLRELSGLLPMVRSAFRADVHPELYVQFTEGSDPAIDSIVERNDLRPAWYRLEPQTEKILAAIRGFWPKLRDRLKDRKDLTAIESAVADLADYLYTEIPEISEGTVEDKQRLERFGMEALNSFAETINSLEPYRSEPMPTSREEKVSQGVASTGQRLNALFLHPNIGVAFLVWLILTSILFSLGFSLALHYLPSLKLDTTLLTVWVGGPITTSVTAVTIPRVGKQRDKTNGQV